MHGISAESPHNMDLSPRVDDDEAMVISLHVREEAASKERLIALPCWFRNF